MAGAPLQDQEKAPKLRTIPYGHNYRIRSLIKTRMYDDSSARTLTTKVLPYAVRWQLVQSGQAPPGQRRVRPHVDHVAVVEGAEYHAKVADAAMALVARRRGQCRISTLARPPHKGFGLGLGLAVRVRVRVRVRL